MRDAPRITIAELAALLGISGVHAWRISRRFRSLRKSGMKTVSAQEALDVKRRRDAEPANRHGGRRTVLQRFQSDRQVSSGPGRQHRPAGGNGGGQRVENRGLAATSAASPSKHEFVPTLMKVR